MDDKLIERMVALVREMATSNGPCRSSEAAEILKLIDPPVDPDLLAAEKLVDEAYSLNGITYHRKSAIRHIDDSIALAGIKFGRAHALSDLAKLPDDFARAKVLGERSHTSRIDDIADGIAYGRAQLEPQRTVPPIEQDLIDAREICAQVAIERQRPFEAAEYRGGQMDKMPAVVTALQHLTSRRKP